MLLVLSPAKKLDFETDWQTNAFNGEAVTQPAMLADAQVLIKKAKTLSSSDLKAMMGLSDNLADLNVERFKAFKTPFTEGNSRPAIDAFKGDVYVGLDAPSLSAEDRAFAQSHLRILSGLYGLLKPLDLMQAYRLEMGTKFQNERGTSLYQFWGEKIAQQLNADFEGDDGVLVNLASTEYFKAVKQKALNARIITPVFKDTKDGKTRVVSFLAKKARGMMARYIIENRITDHEKLKAFNAGGYEFDQNLSDGDTWVFTREQPAPGQA
ncbi:peroxide stress protein YaaA [Kordiimonas sp. SCSIO 12610]|uniref:peroxide stress protein YaaA n=1 Tax=Kordiimonas sp. SCSIO 12610 TaxID=2829597 RepID=UPI00210DD05B|nr:peroxide stress protein YaaA [Kordiimonas sp. SCSIO 12610]UTW54580.1 peroxide stress protein YaaA [Kordiimonas sp. SCSIO 12610]